MSDENEEEKKDIKYRENNSNKNKNYSPNIGYNNDYYGYNNHYLYSSSKKYRKKKGGKKFFNKEQFKKDSGYKNLKHDFVNTNSTYMRNSNSEFRYSNNNDIYGKGRSYSNKNYNFYGEGKKNENENVTRPMFINSKLENNGNPEGNFVKINIASEENKNINLTNIGEVPVNDSGANSVLTIKSLLIGKEPEKNETKIENKNGNIISKDNNNINNSSLPWRSGSFFAGKGGGEYKKDYYNKNYWNNKNNYYYSNGKNYYNKNRYSLNQPQSKKMNKFD